MMEPARVFEDGAVAAAVLVLLAAALRRANISQGSAVRIWGGAALAAGAWYALASTLAIHDTFKASTAARFPALPVALLLPMIVAFLVLARSGTARKLIDATPLWWLVAIQTYRIVGAEFVALWANGDLPSVFALPAGFGDIFTGVLAVPVALSAARDPLRARGGVLLWNVIGILDFLVAIGTGFLSSPGKFHILALGQPNLLGSVYPLDTGFHRSALLHASWALPLEAVALNAAVRSQASPCRGLTCQIAIFALVAMNFAIVPMPCTATRRRREPARRRNSKTA